MTRPHVAWTEVASWRSTSSGHLEAREEVAEHRPTGAGDPVGAGGDHVEVRFDESVREAASPSEVDEVLADVQDWALSPRSPVKAMVTMPPGPTRVGTRWREVVRLGPGTGTAVAGRAGGVPLRLGVPAARGPVAAARAPGAGHRRGLGVLLARARREHRRPAAAPPAVAPGHVGARDLQPTYDWRHASEALPAHVLSPR
jgi:hypothetical protein